MSQRPEGVSKEEWREKRNRVWGRRNAVLNLLIVVVCGAVLVRYCS